MKNTFEWISTTGTEFKIEISYAEKLVEEVLHFDGYEVNTGKKEVRVNANLVLFVSGKKVDSCWDTNFWGMIDVKDKELNAMGITKKIWGLKAVFTEERAEEIKQFIADYVAANKIQEVIAFEKEVAEEEKTAQVADAKKIVAIAEKQSEIPTAEVAKAQMKKFNDIYNEGGEGYVPQIIDIDTYNRALDVIKSK